MVFFLFGILNAVLFTCVYNIAVGSVIFAMRRVFFMMLLCGAVVPQVTAQEVKTSRVVKKITYNGLSVEEADTCRERMDAILRADSPEVPVEILEYVKAYCKPHIRHKKGEKTSFSERVVNGRLLRLTARYDAANTMLWLLKERKADALDMLWDNYGHPASDEVSHLHIAAQYGSVKAARVLLAAGVNVNVVDAEANTPLILAAAADATHSHEMVELLLKHGANASLRNFEGRSAIDYVPADEAASFNTLALCGGVPKDTARYAAWLQDMRPQGNSAQPAAEFLYAVYAGDCGLAESALSQGVDVNAPLSSYNIAPLRVAIAHGDAAMVRLLLRHGAQFPAPCTADYFPWLYAAVLCGNPDVLDLLPYEEPKADSADESPLLVALRGNCGAAMTAAVLERCDEPSMQMRAKLSARNDCVYQMPRLGTKDTQSQTLLLSRDPEWSLSGDVYNPVRKPEELRELLATPGFYAVDKRGRWNTTPLGLARDEGQAAVVQLLQEAGADTTPVKAAFGDSAAYVVKGADDASILSGVEKALAENAVEFFCKLPPHLLQADAGVVTCAVTPYLSAPFRGTRYYSGNVLKLAAAAGKTDILRVLLARPHDLESADIYGQTAIEYAAANGHVECVHLLLNAGAKRHKQALQLAAMCGQHAVVDYLLKRGVRPGLAPEYALLSDAPHPGLLAHRTPDVDVALGIALTYKHPQAVQRLIDMGALVNRPNFFPLHESTNVEVLRVLVQAGAELSRKNAQGLTPAERHRKNGSVSAAEYLESLQQE